MSNLQAKLVVAFAAAVVAAVALTAPAPSHAAYILTEISVPGADNTAVWDINNSGTMVGFSYASSAPNATSFIRSSSGSFSTLTGPAGAISTNALGISDTGVVVGSYSSSLAAGGGLGPAQGFIYSGGSYTTFAVAGADQTLLRGISPDGRYISGYYTTAAQPGVGFVYDTVSGLVQIVSQPTSLFTIAQGMNNAGQLVGGDVLSGSPNTYPGFIYDIATSTRTDLMLAGATRTALRSIDDSGVVAGWFIDGGSRHGFVGSISSYEQIDFAGASDTSVEGSNNARWLVGEYLDATGIEHGFVAVPVPLPGSLALVLAGLAACVGAVRRR